MSLWRNWNPHTIEVEMPLWKAEFLKMLNIELPYDLAILFLAIYPKEQKMYVHTKICTQMSIEILFIITLEWKQLKCLSVDE